MLFGLPFAKINKQRNINIGLCVIMLIASIMPPLSVSAHDKRLNEAEKS